MIKKLQDRPVIGKINRLPHRKCTCIQSISHPAPVVHSILPNVNVASILKYNINISQNNIEMILKIDIKRIITLYVIRLEG